MGYRNGYKRYMFNLGYDVSCSPNGAVVVKGINGKVVDPKEFVSFSTYYKKWRTDYPQLKVSRPVEDICQYCYVYANRHRYLANHSSAVMCGVCNDSDEMGIDVDEMDASSLEIDEREQLVLDSAERIRARVAESASSSILEESEQLVLESAERIRMARAQQALYQQKMEDAQRDASEGKEHTETTYTYVVDFGKNMEMPIYNSQQPGCTYYYSPLSVYNLGMVDHAYEYDDGTISEHMFAHVYNEGVGKKGANNVASLIVKTLHQQGRLQKDCAGGELNIFFDNCSGQNKNNTVIKLAGWLRAMGYFKTVNFVFLVVGHTKNAADRLFNSLKKEYRKKNMFTMKVLCEALNASNYVTIIPTVVEDFLDYDALFKQLYRDLSSQVKQNHIFTCVQDNELILRESNLEKHEQVIHNLSKRGKVISNAKDLEVYSSPLLTVLECSGINPYKRVELWKNYGPHVDPEYQDDALYAELDAAVLALVKGEKSNRKEFRARINAAKKAGMLELIENVAFGRVDAEAGSTPPGTTGCESDVVVGSC